MSYCYVYFQLRQCKHYWNR